MSKPGTTVLLLLATVSFLLIIAFQAWTFVQNPASARLPEITTHKGPVSLTWTWTSGANKPLIQLGDEVVLEISGWASDAAVDEQAPVSLWNHHMGVNVSADSLFATYNRVGEYLLEQQVNLRGDNTVRLRYFVTPYHPLDSIELRLGHYKWQWREAALDGQTFFGTDDKTWTRVTFGGNFQSGQINEIDGGVNFIDAYYRLSDVQERTLLVDETIEFGKP